MKSIFKINIISLCLLVFACTKEKNYKLTVASDNPVVNALDPGQAPANSLLTVTGSGLGDIRSIVFDSGNIGASFNPVFNTDNSLMFRVPLEALPGQQKIVFTNGAGKQFSLPFKVMGLPAVS